MRNAPPIEQRRNQLTTPPNDKNSREHFLELSSALTGFSTTELLSTGMAGAYYDTCLAITGDAMVGRLLIAWKAIASFQPKVRDPLIAQRILADNTIGPLARNVISLWYLGQWCQLPAAWRDEHGAHANDMDQIVSPEAYVESLVWKAMRGHPQGAKQPGYGSWALEPVREEDDE